MDCREALQQALETNTTLEHLELGENPRFYPEAAEAWQLAYRIALLIKQRDRGREVGGSCRYIGSLLQNGTPSWTVCFRKALMVACLEQRISPGTP